MPSSRVPEESQAVLSVRVWYATTNEVEAPTDSVVLTRDEVTLLERVLHGYVSDLRMEIVATDNPGMRRDLREEEATLLTLLSRLEPLRSSNSGALPQPV
jgi:hypothetical protein